MPVGDGGIEWSYALTGPRAAQWCLDAAIERTDIAMYRAENTGRDRTVVPG